MTQKIDSLTAGVRDGVFDAQTQTSIVTAKFQASKKDRRISGEAFSFGQQQDKKEEAMNKDEIRGGTRHSLTR